MSWVRVICVHWNTSRGTCKETRCVSCADAVDVLRKRRNDRCVDDPVVRGWPAIGSGGARRFRAREAQACATPHSQPLTHRTPTPNKYSPLPSFIHQNYLLFTAPYTSFFFYHFVQLCRLILNFNFYFNSYHFKMLFLFIKILVYLSLVFYFFLIFIMKSDQKMFMRIVIIIIVQFLMKIKFHFAKFQALWKVKIFILTTVVFRLSNFCNIVINDFHVNGSFVNIAEIVS